MTELERRALLGDAEAQRECTAKGIVLACTWCGCDERDMIGLSVYHEQYFYSCEACGCNGPIVFDNDTCDYPGNEALVKWNTRPAPPIGRCGEWIPKEDESISKRNRLIRYKVYSCSICGRSNGKVRKKFCPNCGARMDGEHQ